MQLRASLVRWLLRDGTCARMSTTKWSTARTAAVPGRWNPCHCASHKAQTVPATQRKHPSNLGLSEPASHCRPGKSKHKTPTQVCRRADNASGQMHHTYHTPVAHASDCIKRATSGMAWNLVSAGSHLEDGVCDGGKAAQVQVLQPGQGGQALQVPLLQCRACRQLQSATPYAMS